MFVLDHFVGTHYRGTHQTYIFVYLYTPVPSAYICLFFARVSSTFRLNCMQTFTGRHYAFASHIAGY